MNEPQKQLEWPSIESQQKYWERVETIRNFILSTRNPECEEANRLSGQTTVSVLAEAVATEKVGKVNDSGEARESTDTKLKRPVEQVASGPRGGGLSPEPEKVCSNKGFSEEEWKENVKWQPAPDELRDAWMNENPPEVEEE